MTGADPYPLFDGRHVLLLEDDLIVAMDLEDTLLDLGFALVTHARDSDEALDALAKAQLDVALLDVNLGKGQSSLPVAEALLQADVPFALTTGYSNVADLPERLRTLPLLSKPLGTGKLTEVLTELLGGGSVG